ncbi:MAG: Tyrosine recombinase XerD [Bacteroidetes bacterium ADurb.Bin123]|jgi:site-specific recombinase XerD|nr:MAG: Tyrosine recombinase XerD [Bacteroidetes bacterium ADurb.Bin123]HPW36810.1 site-specific integrase [Syntrophorhabdus sp.]
MKKNLNLLLYLRRAKTKKNGEAPIYLRITVDGIRSETPTGRSIIPSKWNADMQMQIGKSEEARTLNHFLDSIRQRISQDANILIDQGIDYSAEQLKNRFNGIKEQPKTLVSIFEENNSLVKQEENKKYSHSTVRQYNTTLSRLKEFLIKEYGRKDIPVTELDAIFIRRYEIFLRSVYNTDHNTVMKYLKQLKKVIHFAMGTGYLDRDPFMSHKTAFKDVSRDYLTADELDSIRSKEIKIRRVDRVRDVFVFACYTGIAYGDLKILTTESISRGIDGKDWIIYHRGKTGIRASIPLLPPALEIIEKYRTDPECNADGKLLPVISNQKLNSYLSEIAGLCGIEKKLTTHVARHTFATTVTLSQGVPIETVSKMLGHTSLKTTQIYAKVVDRKIADDMSQLEKKLQKNSDQKVRQA